MNDAYHALALKALEFVPDGGRIGLGSGHTTEAFLEVLGERVRQGLRVRGVATSEATAHLARNLGIPVDPLDAGALLDVTIDGADEVEPRSLNLIKGWGGALVRERIVAAASRRQIILVTQEKLVDKIGQRGKLPVEVIPFAVSFCRKQIEHVSAPGGLRPFVREHEGQPLVTDNGNWILDCQLQGQSDPETLEQMLLAIPGVVDTGLFLGTASVVLALENGQIRAPSH